MFSLKQSICGRTLRWMAASSAVGCVVGQIFLCWLSLCGDSPPSILALMTGLLVGVVAADWAGDLLPVQSSRSRWVPLPVFTLTIILTTFCWMMPELLEATLLAGCESARGTGFAASYLTFLFPAMLVGAITATGGLFFQAIISRPYVGEFSEIWINSLFAGAIGAALLVLNSWVNMPLALLPSMMILLAVGCCIASSIFRDSGDERQASDDRMTRAPRYQTSLHFFAAGLLCVVILETVARLLALTAPVLLIAMGTTGGGLLILSSTAITRLLKVDIMNAVALVMMGLLPLAFLSLAEFNVWTNTQIIAPVIVIRSLQLAIFLVAALLPAMLNSQYTLRRTGGRIELLSTAAGILFAYVSVEQGRSLIMMLALGVFLHALPIALRVLPRNLSAFRRPTEQIRTFVRQPAVALLTIPALALLGSLDSVQTSALIFSPRTAAAIERGVERDLIPESDANRLIATRSGASGELSVWRRAGNIVEFQRNGRSLGRVSTNTDLTPQPVEDVLPTIIALASHPQPARVLMLGDETGAGLRTCSNFPLQEIVAIRPEKGVTKLAQQFTWSTQPTPADTDRRVTIVETPPIVALRTRGLRTFDVVIAASDSAATLSAASEFTTEFYSAARTRMTTDGIFCQRFRQNELGPEPVKMLMATLRKVFHYVGVVQTVPGELVCIATNRSTGIFDPEFLVRLQREHIRREIAATGWDWAQVAILPLVDTNDRIGIFSHEKRPIATSISNPRFLMTLPFEAARTADKGSETRQAFAPHQIQLLAKIPTGEDHQEVKRRLSALTQQMEICAGMPDQPWTYRKSLRMEMQQSPRPPQEIIQAGHVEKTVHPLDQFSRDYFQTLGRALTAASTAQPATDLLQELERFTDNPEPLLSHFAHYEIVRLHEMTSHPSPADEFRHRLHIVFFSSPSDASVRPVISAVEQLVAQSDLVPDEADRYDMLNSLLQKLIERWEARTVWEPRSAVRVQNDVDKSVRVTNLALNQMEACATAAKVQTSDYLLRRRYLNAALIGPLRNYRDQVLAHRMKTEAPATSDSEDPDDMPLLINSDDNLRTN